ncbi:hypothetical protein DPMN_083022 [Dreissena polymorpha]|uniref:Uncharacterized protein n=1 Tax=Dreissena polymorpha TaxID=45954 RepID=A0A9D3YB39_DREPO|nr:hypothetical protein DPMN_083022 [Dreissena polymorpha]
MIFGTDRLLTNRLNASMNVSSDKSGTTSRCTARVLAQVNRQMYTFCIPVFSLTRRAPVKTTPVTMNGASSETLSFGSGGEVGTL